jgi:transcriptional regulator with XRE-family HTH domain
MAMDIERAFGEVLRQERKNKSLSQEELAHFSDLDRTYISMLERGKRQPSLKTIFMLASTLNTLPSEIMVKVESLLNKRY